MAIDIKKLQKGEKVTCPLCNIGYFTPLYGVTAEKAGHFKCTNCGEKLIINISMKQPQK